MTIPSQYLAVGGIIVADGSVSLTGNGDLTGCGISWTGGDFSVDISLSNVNLTLDGGDGIFTLDGVNGGYIWQGSLTWNSGEVLINSGGVVFNGVDLLLDGGDSTFTLDDGLLEHPFEFGGTATWQSGTLSLINGAILALNDYGDPDPGHVMTIPSGSEVTLNVSSGSYIYHDENTDFINNGTLHWIGTGMSQLPNITNNGTIVFGDSEHQIDLSGVTLSGGTYEINGAAQVTTSLIIDDTATLIVNGYLALDDATLTNYGSFIWSSGEISLTNGSSFLNTSTGDVVLDGGSNNFTLDSSSLFADQSGATFEWDSGNLSFLNSSTITESTGPFDAPPTAFLTTDNTDILAAFNPGAIILFSNGPDLVALSGDNSVACGEEYTLDLGQISSTLTAYDTITYYGVNWGDGSDLDPYAYTGNTVHATHTYSDFTSSTSISISVHLLSDLAGYGDCAALTITVDPADNAAPTVGTGASADPATVTGTSVDLSVLGDDDAGETNLRYSWAATSSPSGSTIVFSDNGSNSAKNATATFSKAGNYTLEVTITDALDATVTSQVSLTVQQTLSSITMDPVSIGVTQQRQLHATTLDQFAAPMTTQPTTFTWSLGTGDPGSLSSSGVYTGPSQQGSATVTASYDGLSASMTINSVLLTVIDFDTNLPPGVTISERTILSNQFPGVTFSSTYDVIAYASEYYNNYGDYALVTIQQGVNSPYTADPDHFLHPFTIDFATPVRNLSFKVKYINDFNSFLGQIEVYVLGELADTVSILSDETGTAPGTLLIDLSAEPYNFQQITKLVFKGLADTYGLGFDDFTFDNYPEDAFTMTIDSNTIEDGFHDRDHDAVPDYADGYNRDTTTVNDDDLSAGHFRVITLTVPESSDFANGTITFNYNASDPVSVHYDTAKSGPDDPCPYLPDTNNHDLRLWLMKDADVARNAATVNLGGDYISSSTFSLADLGLTAENRTIEIYVEGVNLGSDTITATLHTNGREICRTLTVTVTTTSPEDHLQWLQQAVDSAGLHMTAVYNAVAKAFDIPLFDASAGFTRNRTNMEHVYAYYANLYATNLAATGIEHFCWVGMAKLAGATVYAGLEDIVESRIYLERAAYLASPSEALWWISPTVYNAKLAKVAAYSAMAASLQTVEKNLVGGSKAVFIDVAYVHEAYANDGLYAIEELYFRPNSYAAETQITRGTYDAWVKIDTGTAADIHTASVTLARREQQVILEPYFAAIDAAVPIVRTGGGIAMGALAVSPIPTGNGFWTYAPGHIGDNFANFTQRWAWITVDMFPHYLAPTATRAVWIATPLTGPTGLTSRAHTFAPLSTALLIAALGY